MSEDMGNEAWAGSILEMAFKPKLGPDSHKASITLIMDYLRSAAGKGIAPDLIRQALRRELIDNGPVIAPLPVILRRARRNCTSRHDPLGGLRSQENVSWGKASATK